MSSLAGSPRNPRPRRVAAAPRKAPALPEAAQERPTPRRRAAAKTAPMPSLAEEPRELLSEIVFMHLYDVGRSVDLRKVAALIPANEHFDIVKRRDTPASLSLPHPLVLALGDGDSFENPAVESFSARAKIYEEGAIVVLIRVKLRLPFGDLALVRRSSILSGDRHLSLDTWAEEAFRKAFAAIRPAIDEARDMATCDRETYTAWCLIDSPADPAEFLETHREAAAAFLIGDTEGDLHPSQVLETLGRPLSYRRGDLAIFDLDRCLIIDPKGDYEDLLLIIEHANWQLLELRVLDKLLDRWLDEAEDELRLVNTRGRKGKPRGSTVWNKLARIQSLRFDALFILENVENSSKIIGDYYLGQVYSQLCEIFSTDGWKWSVERRLDILENVYDMVKTDRNENRLITLEIWFIVVCVVIPIIQIYIMLKPGH